MISDVSRKLEYSIAEVRKLQQHSISKKNNNLRLANNDFLKFYYAMWRTGV